MRATFRNLFNMLNVVAFLRDRHDHAMSVVRWTLILVPLATLIGTLCAAFLWSLDAATQARFDHAWLLYLLPAGGAAIALRIPRGEPMHQLVNPMRLSTLRSGWRRNIIALA